MMINLSTELLTPSFQGCELMMFRSQCRRSHISSAVIYFRCHVFLTFSFMRRHVFYVGILKSGSESLEGQFQVCFGGKIQFERVQAQVQLCLY